MIAAITLCLQGQHHCPRSLHRQRTVDPGQLGDAAGELGDLSGAATFNLYLSTANSCSAPYVQSYTNITSRSFGLTTIGDGTYYVCVAAVDAAGNMTTASNSPYPFLVSTGGGVAGPGPFTLTAPVTMTASLTPTIAWTLASGAVKYNLTVASDIGCQTVVESDTNVTTNSRALSTTLTNGTTYYACVTALDANGVGRLAVNQPFAFKVNTTAPGAFSIAGPASPATSATPQVSWGSAAGAVTYNLFVNNASTCIAPYVQRYLNLTSRSQTLTALGNGTYYVCVAGVDAAGNATNAANNLYSFAVTANTPSTTGPAPSS